MAAITKLIITTFTAPQELGTNPQLMLWALPLAAGIAIVYKATKLPTIKTAVFLREAGALFASIVVFMALVALALYIVSNVVIQ